MDADIDSNPHSCFSIEVPATVNGKREAWFLESSRWLFFRWLFFVGFSGRVDGTVGAAGIVNNWAVLMGFRGMMDSIYYSTLVLIFRVRLWICPGSPSLSLFRLGFTFLPDIVHKAGIGTSCAIYCESSKLIAQVSSGLISGWAACHSRPGSSFKQRS